jgi:hypothetical protein
VIIIVNRSQVMELSGMLIKRFTKMSTQMQTSVKTHQLKVSVIQFHQYDCVIFGHSKKKWNEEEYRRGNVYCALRFKVTNYSEFVSYFISWSYRLATDFIILYFIDYILYSILRGWSPSYPPVVRQYMKRAHWGKRSIPI